MEPLTLMENLRAYGADMRGINDRFMGDAELYAKCYIAFLAERSFDSLRAAMEAGDCSAAFDAAHALKGVAGNLGLTPAFDALCALVESLRAKRFAEAPAEYDRVLSEQKLLESFLR